MKINNNTDLKKTRDIFQKIVDILDEGIEIDKRQANGEEISEEEYKDRVKVYNSYVFILNKLLEEE